MVVDLIVLILADKAVVTKTEIGNIDLIIMMLLLSWYYNIYIYISLVNYYLYETCCKYLAVVVVVVEFLENKLKKTQE